MITATRTDEILIKDRVHRPKVTAMSMNWNPIMVDGSPNGNGTKRLFEPVFNLGSIVTILGLLIGGLTAFYSVKEDLRAQTVRADSIRELLDVRTAAVDRQLGELTAGIASINNLIISRAPTRYTRDDANHDLGLVNTRIDGHEQRILRLEVQPAK